MSLLSINHLCVQYKNNPPVLDNFSLTIQPHEIVALRGSNGTGKTTIAGVLAGLLTEYSGEILYAGGPWHSAGPAKTAFAFDHPAFPPFMSARSILRYFARAYGTPAQEVEPLLLLTGLKDIKKHYRHFSRGMRQSLGIAVALAKKPELLVIDEGFSAIDGPTKKRLFAHLREAAGAGRLTVVFTTHSEEDAADLAQRTITLKKPADAA